MYLMRRYLRIFSFDPSHFRPLNLRATCPESTSLDGSLPLVQRQMMQETNGNHQSLEYFLEILNCRRIMPTIHLVTQLTATSGPFFSGHNKPADVSKAKVDMLATWSQTENMVGLLVTGCCMNGTKKWGAVWVSKALNNPAFSEW